MKQISDSEGMKIGGVNTNNLRYADDIALIANSQEKLSTILDGVVTASEDKGLSLNVQMFDCIQEKDDNEVYPIQ